MLSRIVHYVKDTEPHHGLQLHKQSTYDLIVYFDVDWTDWHDIHYSTTGYAIYLFLRQFNFLILEETKHHLSFKCRS
jgi:hypothetical protein